MVGRIGGFFIGLVKSFLIKPSTFNISMD